jgi:hypothetical protein
MDAHFIIKKGIIKDIRLPEHFTDLSSARKIRSQFIGARYEARCPGV